MVLFMRKCELHASHQFNLPSCVETQCNHLTWNNQCTRKLEIMPFGKEKDRLQNVGMSEKEFELAFIV